MARWERILRKRDANWWDQGVHFTCLPDCGKCCDEPGGIVFLSRNDAERIAKHFNLDLKEWIKNHCRTSHDGRFILESKPEDGRCIYLNKDKKCDIYEVKPSQCSAFPFWGENLISERSWSKTKQICPGIDYPDAILIDKKRYG